MPDKNELPLIVAHRGASAAAPENTLAAFARAIAGGADGIEFDVRLARDGVPVVFHDASLQRMARRKDRVSALTSAELQNLDVGSWFNQRFPRRADEKFSGETIPTLAQTFDFLRGFEGRIYVEVKGLAREISLTTEAIVREIQQTDLLPRIILKSFDLSAIAQAKRIFPAVRAAALFAPKILPFARRQIRLIEQAKHYGADELSLHHSLASGKLLESARQENLPVTIWTVDRPVWVLRALDAGIRAIITNDPARLVAARDEITRKEFEK